MSTDTALALGMLALVGRGTPDRLRAFLLTVSIVDDVAALIVISIVYSNGVKIAPLLVSLAVFAVIVALVAAGVSRGLIYAALGVGAWLALSASRIDPIVIGIAMGLLTSASPAARGDLERASDLFRRFREQPTSELQRSARLGLESAVSPNERLQMQFHPWASYFVVPLFALANAGIIVRGRFLAHALQLTDHARHTRGFRSRQTRRSDPLDGDRHHCQSRTDPVPGRVGGAREWGNNRRHRLHGFTSHREPRDSEVNSSKRRNLVC